jgi:hypothetical protein
MSWLFICWAALVYPVDLARLTGQPLIDARPSNLSTIGAALRATTPLLLALATCALLVLEIALRNTAPLIQIVFVCAGIFLLPVIRQALTLIDNLVLNERLRVALNQSQQAFQSGQQELLSSSSRAEKYDELRTGIEHLQSIHALLARGNFRARAQVQGPLSPVAHSLNLLIERMNSWARYLQANRVLETEASYLRQTLEDLSEGKLSTTFPRSYSLHQTGRAILATMLLQNRLAHRFGQMRENVEKLEKQWQGMSEAAQQARQHFQVETEREQQERIVQDMLLQMNRRLISSQHLLQSLRRQIEAYELYTGPRNTSPLLDGQPRSTTSRLSGSE